MLTGGIACGKSLFAEFLRGEGIQTLDADDVTHELERPGGDAVSAIRECFGDKVIDEAGGVDRKALAKIVFADSDARNKLNSILHPLVRQRLKKWVLEPSDAVKVAVIPLLFECGWEGDWDVIVCLVADEETQMDRLVRTRGYSEWDAKLRIASQMHASEKAARSQIVIRNDDNEEALHCEARRVAEILRTMR